MQRRSFIGAVVASFAAAPLAKWAYQFGAVQSSSQIFGKSQNWHVIEPWQVDPNAPITTELRHKLKANQLDLL